MFLLRKFSIVLLSGAMVWAAPETTLWESGKVVAIEQVSTPAREPDPTCRAVAKSAVPPPQCRESNLKAQKFWNVTIEVGNKRLVVRPYRAVGILGAIGQAERAYIDPKLTVSMPVEVSLDSTKSIRYRTDQGQGIQASVESQELLAASEVPRKAELTPPPGTEAPALQPPSFKVSVLENGDFLDLETQPLKSEGIGDGAVLYSFAGESSPSRVTAKKPIFLILSEAAETVEAAGGDVELSRLQAGKGMRQLVSSAAKKRSASSVATTVTQVSATVRKVSPTEDLKPGKYALLVGNSDRAFLFEVR